MQLLVHYTANVRVRDEHWADSMMVACGPKDLKSWNARLWHEAKAQESLIFQHQGLKGQCSPTYLWQVNV